MQESEEQTEKRNNHVDLSLSKSVYQENLGTSEKNDAKKDFDEQKSFAEKIKINEKIKHRSDVNLIEEQRILPPIPINNVSSLNLIIYVFFFYKYFWN